MAEPPFPVLRNLLMNGVSETEHITVFVDHQLRLVRCGRTVRSVLAIWKRSGVACTSLGYKGPRQRDQLPLLYYLAPMLVFCESAKDVFRAAFAGLDVDEIKPELAFTECLGFLQPGEFDRIPAKPILGIRPKGHTPLTVVPDHGNWVLP